MHPRRLLNLGLISLMPAALLTLSLAASALAVGVGDPAPDFNLPSLNGTTESLSAESGGVVLLFFMGYNAGACEGPARDIETHLYGPLHDKGFEVFGIDCWNGTQAELAGFAQRTGVSFPLLMMGQVTARDHYDMSYGNYVVVDDRGVIAYVSGNGSAPSDYDRAALSAVINRLLDESSSVNERTWGAIKTLYGRKSRR